MLLPRCHLLSALKSQGCQEGSVHTGALSSCYCDTKVPWHCAEDPGGTDAWSLAAVTNGQPLHWLSLSFSLVSQNHLSNELALHGSLSGWVNH